MSSGCASFSDGCKKMPYLRSLGNGQFEQYYEIQCPPFKEQLPPMSGKRAI